MRAFYDPAQAAHNPSQMMRHGRIVTPKDLPERTARLLQALVELRIPVAAPEKDNEAARVAVHTAGFLHYLSTAWERWQALPDHGPEVWPNTFPYWSGRPEDRARPDCPAAHILAQTGWYLGDLSVSMGPRRGDPFAPRRTPRWRRRMRLPRIAASPTRCAAPPGITRAPIVRPASAS